MKKTISGLPAPALAGVVREANRRAAIAAIQNCYFEGADMIDLHLSCLEDPSPETLRAIISASKLPVLALNYNFTWQQQDAGYDESSRTELMLRAVDAGAAGVDMQGYTFDLPSKSAFCGEDKYSFTKNAPREVVTDEAVIARQCDFIGQVHEKGAEVLLSCHTGIPMSAETVVELALFLEKRNPDVIKIVSTALTEADMLESLRAMRLIKSEVKTPVSYHANGEQGKLSRILNPILGGHMIFCVDRYGEASTLEQPPLRTVRTILEEMKKLL